MKKMTIALLTAAAMGTSGFAMAEANLTGRVDVRAQNLEDEDTDFSQANTKLAASGGSELIAGMTGSYYARMGLADDGEVNNDYVYGNIAGDFGDVRFGRDDDIAYKMVTSRTDLFRGIGPVNSYTNASGVDAVGDVSLQYQYAAGGLTVGAYADTLDYDANGDKTATAEGINNTQVGAHYDFGMLDVGVVYADSEGLDDDEIGIGATVETGVATVSGWVTDSAAGNNPYVVTASVPMTDIFTAVVGVGNDDADDETSDVAAIVYANMGGGLDLNLGYRNGDSGDGVEAGFRYNF